MDLNMVVCIKPVPDPDNYDQVSIDPETKRITREGIPTIINPVDKNAIEAALQLKKAYGGKVTVMTMSPPNAVRDLREALAMGADEAVLLSDRAFGGADTLATSYTLAKGIEKLGKVDIVFCGTESADGATSQVPPQLGEWLGLPHLWNVFDIGVTGDGIFKLKTKLDIGYQEWEIATPCLISVSREVNEPRFVSAMGIIKSKNKPILTWGKDDLDVLDEKIGLTGSPTKAGKIFEQVLSREGKVYDEYNDQVFEAIIQGMKASGINPTRLKDGRGANS